MTSKVCDTEMRCCHWTALGMDGFPVANGFSLYIILLCCEEEAGEVGTGLRGRSCGG